MNELVVVLRVTAHYVAPRVRKAKIHLAGLMRSLLRRYIERTSPKAFPCQVLINGLGVPTLAEREFDEVEIRLAGAGRRASTGRGNRARVGGQDRIWPAIPTDTIDAARIIALDDDDMRDLFQLG
jgi:hypothetical protein